MKVITIDGPGGAGKGTLSSLLAQHLNWMLLDSGALYRLCALAVKQHSIDPKNEQAVATIAEHLDVRFVNEDSKLTILLEGQDVTNEIRTEQVAKLASQIAPFKSVRQSLLNRQRAFAQHQCLVADGRDMGTVVFPNAPVKFFLTASANVRAQRRVTQLQQLGKNTDFDAILKDIQDRDDRDMNREEAPLKPAHDAILIDSSDMDIKEVFEFMKNQVDKIGL
ncbi:(d)CMP kinase [Marinicellulosiphila megalodicopiae]|uniref:(d)CMP kinase n=1 Tax=Marinicellulosiphila megalodicopiae TaxID=2724896 RepID=UPI003BAEB878